MIFRVQLLIYQGVDQFKYAKFQILHLFGFERLGFQETTAARSAFDRVGRSLLWSSLRGWR